MKLLRNNTTDRNKALKTLERTLEASRGDYNDSPVHEKPIYNGSSSNLRQNAIHLNYHPYPGRVNKFTDYKEEEDQNNKERNIEKQNSKHELGSSYQYFGIKTNQSVLKTTQPKNEEKRKSFSNTSEKESQNSSQSSTSNPIEKSLASKTSEQSDKSVYSNGAKVKEDYSGI